MQEEYFQLLREGLLGDLPIYLFQTPKERKKYFDKLNQDYHNKLLKEKQIHKISHAKKVKFNFRNIPSDR